MNLPDIQSLADIQLLRESVDLECKLAQGRGRQGALPEGFWPTYSAFANTGGGVAGQHWRTPKPEEVFGASSLHLKPSLPHLNPSSLHLTRSSLHLTLSSLHLAGQSADRQAEMEESRRLVV